MTDGDHPFAAPYAASSAEPYGSRSTFCGVPARSVADAEPGDVVILGAPLDWGASHRPGARFGPRAIRDADYLESDGKRPHLLAGIDPLTELSVVDAGDVPLADTRGYLDLSVAEIERYVHAVVERGALPLVLGGDHTVTLPNATAVARVFGYGRIGLLHFDAHADTGVYARAEMLGHGVPMRRLVESGAVPGHRFAQIGLRGYWPPPDTLAWMRDQGIRSYYMSEVVERGLPAVVAEAVDWIGSARDGSRIEGIFLSIDIDVVDPGMAPGTGTPEPGGLTAREMLDAARVACRELDVLGVDIVEVAPHYDQPMNITALLAHRIALEALTGLAERRRSRAPAEPSEQREPGRHEPSEQRMP